ncbi:hypothetical protein [Maliponia aquimaris]|uniref:Uncharacterized protein n=1 Tax=Maliponia aquimaris TaxID=1673631 RepID=A0A238L5J3_9RHOB|nr:hypothetical protein [Maliponia aquimaris]SMX50364.1 hypothetical protein MAA8898_04741 [Maliponia aquimaris]
MAFDHPYAGLILPDVRDLSPEPYLASAARVLARLDPRPERGAPTQVQDSRVMGRTMGIAVIPEEQSDYGPRVVLEVVTDTDSPPDEGEAARLLSDTVREALNHSSADILEWYRPDVLIDREDFIRLRNFVSPAKIAEMDSRIEDALFESVNAAQGICGALYPVVPDDVIVQEVQPKRSKFKGFLSRIGGGLGLRRTGHIAAVTCLFTVLTSSSQIGGLLGPLVP